MHSKQRAIKTRKYSLEERESSSTSLLLFTHTPRDRSWHMTTSHMTCTLPGCYTSSCTCAGRRQHVPAGYSRDRRLWRKRICADDRQRCAIYSNNRADLCNSLRRSSAGLLASELWICSVVLLRDRSTVTLTSDRLVAQRYTEIAQICRCTVASSMPAISTRRWRQRRYVAACKL